MFGVYPSEYESPSPPPFSHCCPVASADFGQTMRIDKNCPFSSVIIVTAEFGGRVSVSDAWGVH